MGQFLTILSRQKKTRPELQFFYNHSLTKIAEFYEQYKSISDTLAIDDSEFSEIFGEQNLSVFEILDTDKNLLIDGLELFAGLVLYSKMIKFEDKIHFLFNLFDFNEQNSLFPNDIEFMFLSCCTFTHKIYGLRSQLNEVWIEEFVRGQFFNGEIKINISEILRWSRQSSIITIFFEEILARPQTDTSSILDKKLYIKQFANPEPQQSSIPSHSLELNQKIYQKYITKIKDKLQTFHEQKIQYANSDVCFDVSWAYGMRLDDLKRVFRAIEYDTGEIEIVYLIGKVCVLFNKESKTQRHYREHRAPILSLETNQKRKIIATGEQGDNPLIRIWSYQTFQTFHILRTNHKNGIHMMNFSKDGNFLAHVGCHSQGSFNIHNLLSNQLIISCFCKTPIVDINELDNFTNVFQIESLMTGLYEISHLTVTAEEYNQTIQNPYARKAQLYVKEHVIQACEFSSDGKPISKITCSAFLMINRNFSYLDEYDETYNKYILTGHQKGEVNVWNSQFKTLQFQLYQQKAQIIKIVVTRDYVIVVSDSSYISFWDVALEKKERSKVIDVTQISYHLHSYNVRDLIPLKNQDQYLVCTAKGDVFILGQQIKENQVVKFSMVQKDYQVELIEEIFPIEGTIVATKLLTKTHQGRPYQQLFYGGSFGVIFTINVKTHLRVSAWNIGQKIVSFDVGESKHHGTIIAAATESNKVYTKIGNIESTQKIEIKDEIMFILLSFDTGTLIVAANYYEKNNILIFTLSQKLTYQLNNTIPLPQKVIYMELIEKKSLLCITQTNSVLLLSLKDLHFKPFDQLERSFPNPVVNIVYFLKEKGNKYIPIIVGAETKAIMMARFDGTILSWRNQDELDLGSRVDLYGHSSYCSSLVFNQEQTSLYSSGFSDNLLIQWSLKFFMEKKTAITGHLLKIQQIEEDEDQFLQRQTAFCVFKNNLLTEMYDQHLLVRGIGSNNDTLSKLFKSMLQEWKIVNQTSLNIRDEPNLGLKLDFVLGMQVFNKTQTVLSLNNRKIAYFVSRVVVIYNPNINKQQIYTGHRFKITCIHKLEGEKGEELIASGESSFRPQIHIWSTQSLETIRIIETSHRWGIINITIHNDKLLSYGLYQSDTEQTLPTKPLNYQFQSIHIWTGSHIASLISKHPAYCMRLHPTRDQIIISTYGCVIFYSNEHGHYRKKSVCSVEDEHVTCMQFYEIRSNKSVDYDLLVGTRRGAVGMVCQEKNFVVVRNRAHEQRINCLLKINIGKDIFFVTTSEDQMLKIWSKKFALMYYSQMKKTQSDDILKGSFDRKGNDLSYLRNRAVQSLTVFSETQGKSPTLLLGTRNGDIFEFIIETDFTEKDPFRNSKYLLYSKNNITQSHLTQTKKVLLAHHPKLEIIVTIGQDQNLLFWDTDASGGGNRFIFSKYLGYTSIPTSMKFTKDGDYLIIGFSDGLLIFLDSKISKSLPGKTDDKFLMPSLSLIKKEKAEENNAILNIELSDSGEHLAVSYNYRIIQTKDKKSQLSNSFISLFNKKARDKVKNFSKMDPNQIFQKFTSITCPYAESIYKTEKSNQYGMAAYSMTFAEGEGKFYLLIYYQLIDCFQNRLNYSTEGKYSVWDVSTSTMIANLDLVGSLSWKKLCFQNSIYSKYMFWKNLIESKQHRNELSQPINNNLYVPHMSALVNIPSHLIMGSVNGDLHIVKASSLQYQGSNPQQKDMFISKTYPGHCSQVNQIEINPDKVNIYTTSVLDECIFKYRLEGSTKLVIQEQSVYDNLATGDIFSEVPSIEDFQKMLSIYAAKEKLQSRTWIDTANFLQKMSIIEIIGRRSSTIRQNIFLDCSRSIIYHVGQSIVNWNPDTKVKRFIYSSDSSNQQLNQITQLCISNDCRAVVAAHSGLEKTSIIMWETNCKNTLREFFVNGMCCVILMALNHDDSRIVLYGMDKMGKAMMILVDFYSYRPLAVVSYAHKPVWSMKAIHFAEESQSIFYTCGVEETKKWTYSGNQLTYQELNNENFQTKKLINLAMLVINKTLVTGTDEGSIILWRNEVFRKQGHDSMVSCLAKDKSLPNTNVFYSGGKDGNLIIWTLEQNTLIQNKKISILNTLSPLEKHTSLNIKEASFSHEIQSINCYRSQIVIGTRNGNIYHSSHEMLNSIHEETPIKEVFAFHDFEVSQALFFNPEETELYEITKDGLFSIWLIKEYKLLHSTAFREETIDMGYHYRSKTVFVAFKKQLRVFYIEKQQSSVSIPPSSQPSNANLQQPPISRQLSYKLRELPELSISLKHITHLSFSNNQKMLALGIESNSDKSIYIEIYEIPEDIRSARIQLKRLFMISLKSPINFIDFSLNNKFLLISSVENVIIRDLAENKSVNQELISKIEWCNEGVQYGKQAEVALDEWMNQWGCWEIGKGEKTKKNIKRTSKMDQSESKSMSKGQKMKKPSFSQQQQLDTQNQPASHLSSTKKSQQVNLSLQPFPLTVSRLQQERFLLIEKSGSLYIYHMQNMISKINLPVTEIDHFSVSQNKNFVAVACEVDKMVAVVDIRKCMVRSVAGGNADRD